VIALTGTGALMRLIVRRDRVRIAVWIVSVVALVVFSAASVKGIYPTPEDLRAAAVVVEGNAAAIAFNGPVQGLDTLGGRIAFETGTFGFILLALMSIFMTVRNTRTEEETGRLELVRATVVGRHAPLVATLCLVSVMNVAVGALVTVGFLAQDLPSAGSVVFGVSFAAVGITFTAAAGVAAQVTENSRVASGLAGAAVGTAFVLRAVGDVGDGTLSWLSPIGWGQKTRAFAGEQWWPLLLPVACSALLVVVALALAARRDLGGALIAPRPGPPAAAPSLGRPVGLAVRLQRGSLLGWVAGVFVLGLVYGSIGNDIEDFVGDNEALRDLLARSGADLVDSYFGTSLLVLALVGSGFAVQSALRLRSEETALRAEPLLATPIARRQWMASHLLCAFAGSAVVLAGGGLGVGLSYSVVTGDPGELPALVVDSLAYLPAVWTLVGLAAALFGLLPRAMAVAWAALAVGFVVGFFKEILDLPGWLADVSPFEQTPLVPAADLAVAPLLVLGLVAVMLTLAGLEGFRRRDLA
jgi:ABC-2 type transport system permease protein